MEIISFGVIAIGIVVFAMAAVQGLLEFLESLFAVAKPKPAKEVQPQTVHEYMMQVVDPSALRMRQDPAWKNIEATVQEVQDKADEATLDIINQITNNL